MRTFVSNLRGAVDVLSSEKENTFLYKTSMCDVQREVSAPCQNHLAVASVHRHLNRTPTDARPEPRTVQNAESRSVFHGGSDSDTLVSSASRWYCRNRAGLVKTLIY